MNFTLQPTFGFEGFTSAWDSINGFSNNAEFVYRPFSFKVTFNSDEIDKNSFDLMEFTKYQYDET